MNKKDLVIVALATFCLTSTLFMILPSRSAERDPWADVSGLTVGEPDGKINMRDIQYLIQLFTTKPSSPNWNPNADINNDGTVNMRDIQIAILNFSKHE